MKTSALRSRTTFTLLSWLVAFIFVAPIGGQSELRPYFSLSSMKTFGAAETPMVYLAGSQVSEVQIRVYRVKDPVEFYRRIEGTHSFGTAEQEQIAKRSFLGEVRSWKRGLRRRIRLFLRGQFTESVSAHLRGPEKKEAKTHPVGSPEAYFADAPVLNRDQLVMSFVQGLGKQTWNSVNVPIRVQDKGIYLVEAVTGKLRAYTIVIKSNLVLITKTGRQHIYAFVADRDSGEPVSGADVIAMKRNGDPETFHTDGQGLAELKVSNAADSATNDLRLVARKDSDTTLNALSLWNFGNAARSWTGYIYTDRPVYRPGDTVHFRGILRISKSPSGYEVPSGESVAVQIQDATGKAVYTKHLTANSVGIIHAEFPTERNAALGSYFIQVGNATQPMTGNFEVQEYKKPEYEVRVTAAKARVLQGESLDVNISARYYFGEPVKNAKVQYSVYRIRYFYPLWRDSDETESDAGAIGDDDESAGEEVLKADGQLDENGLLHVTYKTTVSKSHYDFQYRIEARVTDEGRREISGTGRAVATYGTFLVNAQPDRYFYTGGQTATLRLQALDYDGKPVSAHLQVALLRQEGRRTTKWVTVNTVSSSTGADGSGSAALSVPAEGGSYKVSVSADSGGGRVVESATYVWVAGATDNFFFDANGPHTVQIVPDNKKYAVGETAKILIVTSKPNTPVLVTVERRDVQTIKLLRSTTGTVSFEYAIASGDEPGVYVSAQFIRGGQMYQGQKRLVIPPDNHALNVQIATDKPQYQPGESADYRVKVATKEGRPVAGADLSLGVVDEAIYAIRPDRSPDLLKFFFGDEGSNVYTEDSLSYYFNGEAGERRMLLAMAGGQYKPLAQLKPESLVQPKVRKAFPDTAFWVADLTTDASGTAATKVAFPDSLTTWRATAKAATVDNRFGGATEKTIVRKNIIMRLAVPRFFVEGDETVISGIVHNYLADAKQVKVTVALQGVDLIAGAASQDVTLPRRGDARVDWRVRVKPGTEAKITGEALTTVESDAIEMTLPIRPQGVAIHQPAGGSVAAGRKVEQQITFPGDAESGSRSISIRLSSSLAGPIFNALDFLTSFPYGCVEQTMSSFLPNLMVRKSGQQLSGIPPLDESALNKQVQSGLERLYGMQHEDGGWGWWESDNSHPFMTAYVVAGLAEAKALGMEVKDDALSKGVGWLRTRIASSASLEPDMQAYIAYALARAGAYDAAWAAKVYTGRKSLSPYGIALLGLAFEEAKDARASAMADELIGSVQQNATEAWWPATRDEMLDFEGDVSAEATAYALKLVTHERKDSPVLAKAALWLVNHRNEGYWWSSSKQTAMVIYGILDYLKMTNELNADFTAEVTVNGVAVGTQKFAGSTTVAPEIFLQESKLRQGANQISISTTGSGRLYYSVTGTHYSNAAKMEKEAAVSLNVLRDYFLLQPVQQSEKVVYDLAPLTGAVKSGDIVAVRLTVTGTHWKYLLAEDPIPAGTEFIERDKLYEIRSRPPWWQYWFTRRELHDDHMAIFETEFPQGQQQYFYLLKVVNPGKFHVSPAAVGPMYQPGIQATTESSSLEVTQ